jgi:hypothetical protein
MSSKPAPIRLSSPSSHVVRNNHSEPIHLIDIRKLEWTLHVPEAHAIVETALYRGFFDIIDRTRLEVLRKETEIRWNTRIQSNYATARQRLTGKPPPII